jgi:hypothetical protein
MKNEFSMNNLPEKIKKHIEEKLNQGVLPRSGNFNGINMQLPPWNKYEWQTWAEKHGVDLPDNFLKIAK